jgi:hypothetical protein
MFLAAKTSLTRLAYGQNAIEYRRTIPFFRGKNGESVLKCTELIFSFIFKKIFPKKQEKNLNIYTFRKIYDEAIFFKNFN